MTIPRNPSLDADRIRRDFQATLMFLDCDPFAIEFDGRRCLISYTVAGVKHRFEAPGPGARENTVRNACAALSKEVSVARRAAGSSKQEILPLAEPQTVEPKSTRVVAFRSQDIPTFDVGGVAYVALKPIVEAMGLDWPSQWRRIQRDAVLSTCVVMTTMQVGGQGRQVTILPLDYLNGFLFGIDASRVRADLRDTVIAYQRECYRALAAYWRDGIAVRDEADALAEQADAQVSLLRNMHLSIDRARGSVLGYLKNTVLGRVNELEDWLKARFEALHTRDKNIIGKLDQAHEKLDEIRFVSPRKVPVDYWSMRRLLTERVGLREEDISSGALRKCVDDAEKHWSRIDRTFKRDPNSTSGYPILFDVGPFQDWWRARGEAIFRRHSPRERPVLTLVQPPIPVE